MYVVHVDRQRSFTGQIQRGLAEIDALRAAGHRVGVIAHPGSELARRARIREIEVMELPLRGRFLYTSIFRATRLLRGRGVDALHCHGGRDQQLAFAVSRLARVPHLLRTKHNHTLPHGRRSLRVYRACDRVVTVSQWVRARLIAAGLDPARVVAIPTAVDLERFRPRPRDPALAAALGLAPDDLVIGQVSSLHQRKGVEELLRAFALLRRAPLGARLRCLLVGRRYEQWQPLARELGVAEQVRFAGFREDVEALLPLFDVYVLPSRQEALGTGALEAMAAGCALVVSDVDGLAEAVAPGTGVRVPPGDPQRLADAIARLLADPARRRELGAAARARAESEYGAQALASRMVALYEEVLTPDARATDARPDA